MSSGEGNVAITKDQAATLAFVLQHVQSRDEVETLSFRLSGESGELFYVAVLEIGVDEADKGVSLLVTLPVHSQGVFLAVTAEKQREVARLLANLEDYERDTGRILRPREAVVTDGPGDIKALFLLRTASHSALAELPDSTKINSQVRHFSLVVGIDAMEYARKQKGGADALLDLLQESDKSLLFFG